MPGQTPTSSAVSASSIPTSGPGTFTTVDAIGAPSTASGRVVRYALQIEDGIPVDRAEFARTVHDILLDPRGWQTLDHVKFVNLTAAQMAAGQRPDVRIMLATPATVDTLCAPLQTKGRVSCHNGPNTVLNLMRWQTAVPWYGTDIARYRIYQVNHEVGHAIGHGHQHCPKPGAPAPVMVQQTLSLEGCAPNTWPTVTKG